MAPLTLAREAFERRLTQRSTTSSSSMMLDSRSTSPSDPASSSTNSVLKQIYQASNSHQWPSSLTSMHWFSTIPSFGNSSSLHLHNLAVRFSIGSCPVSTQPLHFTQIPQWGITPSSICCHLVTDMNSMKSPCWIFDEITWKGHWADWLNDEAQVGYLPLAQAGWISGQSSSAGNE